MAEMRGYKSLCYSESDFYTDLLNKFGWNTDILLPIGNTEMEPDKIPKKKKKSPLSTIDKSHRLQQSTRAPRMKAATVMKSLESGKQKHIPPLSVLESMYEDSDEEITEEPSMNSEPPQNNSSHTNDANTTSAQPNGSTSSNVPISPSTAKKYADELLQILDCQTPPLQPVLPMKRYKKPEVPYIVGCMERPKVSKNKNCKVFKGDDYGITSKTNVIPSNRDYEDNKSGFYSGGYNLCKSLFNAQANEIAERLLSLDNNPSHGGSDSDDTVVYEVNPSTSRFSPQPSTSKDDKTIIKNDQKLNRFLKNNVIEKDEPPCEFIEIDDDDDDGSNTLEKHVNTKSNLRVKIDTVIKIEDNMNEIKNINKISNNKTKNKLKRSVQASDSLIIADDYNINSLNGNIIDEIDLTNINVTDLISQNKSLIDKYSKRKTFNMINIVKTDVAASGPAANTKSSMIEQLTNKNNIQNKINLPENMEPPCKKRFFGTCPICLDDLSENTIASTTCGHLFCLDCIKQVVKPKYKRCPTCRKRLTGAGYHKIYL